jgi:hypothetical protein
VYLYPGLVMPCLVPGIHVFLLIPKTIDTQDY